MDDVPIAGYDKVDVTPSKGIGGFPVGAEGVGGRGGERIPLSAREYQMADARSPSANRFDGDGKGDDDEGSGEYEGEHPLEGIANYKDLPAPEGLTGKSK